jgi:TetR/AcrR family tetracycline transcriptional repressor
MVKRKRLTPEGIIIAAIELLGRDGKKRFSMRRLAAYLGVDPMAIYYHIPNRATLIFQIVDSVISKCELPQEALSWQVEVKEICAGFRRMAHQHPEVIQIYAEFHDWAPGDLRLSEAMHSALKVGGFEKLAITKAARLLRAYTENFCYWELNGWIEPLDSESRLKFTENLNQGEYPVTTDLLENLVNIDPEAEFNFGLSVLIAGLEGQLGG